MRQPIDEDLKALIEKVPPHTAEPLEERDDLSELLEIVMDPGARAGSQIPGRELHP